MPFLFKRVPLLSRIRAAGNAHRALLALLIAGSGLYAASPAPAVSRGGLVVVPHTSQPGFSYFTLSGRPGSATQAGTIELRNPTAKPMRVLITPVDGETLGTLGSSYAPPGSRAHGSTRWLRLGSRTATLMPRSNLVLGVSVRVPLGAQPGDYLSGVSVEARDQRPQTLKKGGASIASVSRYVIGAEVSLPGPRHSLIQFTGATLRREPSGLTFALKARNTGNTILQGVHGQVRVTRAGRTVVSQKIEPGTFVAHTAIAYPVNAFRQTPPQGTHYQISAWMRYPGGIAWLNTTVTFGHRAAVAQQQYGGPPAEGGETAWWKIAGIIAAILYGLFTTILLLRRRNRASEKPILP
jgi:hypothetical protein